MKIVKYFFIALFFLAQNSLAQSIFSKNQNFVVAKVNNKAITNIELLDRYNFVVKSSKVKIAKSDDKKLLLSQILDKMIEEEIILQEAKNLEFSASKEEIEEFAELLAIKHHGSLKSFKSFFKKNNLSYQNYLRGIESEVLWTKIIDKVIRRRVSVTNFEVEEFLEQQKYNINVKKFNISNIIISKDLKSSQKLADKIYIELLDGADFETLAEQFSLGVINKSHGSIGWVSQSDIDGKIFKAIQGLKKGDYSKPVLLEDGYRIFRVNDIKVEKTIPDKALSVAQNSIFLRKLQNYTKGYLINLRKKAFIETNL